MYTLLLSATLSPQVQIAELHVFSSCPGNGVTCKLELQLHIHLILIAKCLNVYLCTPNYIARDAARYRDVKNISKVSYALKPMNICFNVTECTSLLPDFPQVGFSMQPPVSSKTHCNIPTSHLLYVGNVFNCTVITL